MKVEPLNNYNHNAFTSNLFCFSLENKAMAVQSWQPVFISTYIVSESDITVSLLSLFSLIMIAYIGFKELINKLMRNQVGNEKNDSQSLFNKYRIILLIFSILFFLGSLPVTSHLIQLYDWEFSFYELFKSLCRMPFFITLIHLIICLIVKACLKENDEEKMKIEKNIKSTIKLLIVLFVVACIPTLLEWTLPA